MNTRKAISKGLRFYIFSRDNFTCRYCGRQSDVVPLHVDHVTPVCRGGTNDEENLITACQDCNLGKSGKLPSYAAPSEADRLRMAQERNEQAAAAHAVKNARESRAAICKEVLNYYCQARGVEEMDSRTLNTISRYALDLGAELVFDWIDSAVSNLGPYKSDEKFGMYISGCRRSHMKEAGQ
jgi:hypothetical protein